MGKIVFIPFTDTEGNGGERGDAASWVSELGFSVVVYNGNKQALIQSAGLFDDIYVVGHGAAGDPGIGNDTGSTDLQYDEVAQRLIDSGLSGAYAGSVKIYACRGGEATDTNLSFAKLFARSLIRDHKRLLTSVYGYTGKLTADVFDEQTIGRDSSGDRIEVKHKKAHKWSKSNVGTSQEKWVKAKEKRKRFFGLV